MDSGNFIIELHDVRKSFNLSRIQSYTLLHKIQNLFKPPQKHLSETLRPLSLKVRRGECLALIGANGSGKTTLLKLIAGIYRPSGGTVSVRGKMIPLFQLGLGINGELTARENILIAGMILGIPKKTLLQETHAILSFAGLERFIDHRVKYFSAGMFMRLGLSIAAKAEGDIYLIDEILSVGDAEFQIKTVELLGSLVAQGKTLIIASHDLPLLQQISHRAVWLHSGSTQESGTTREVIEKYNRFMMSLKQHQI